jgi:hypothetical protein
MIVTTQYDAIANMIHLRLHESRGGRCTSRSLKEFQVERTWLIDIYYASLV